MTEQSEDIAGSMLAHAYGLPVDVVKVLWFENSILYKHYESRCAAVQELICCGVTPEAAAAGVRDWVKANGNDVEIDVNAILASLVKILSLLIDTADVEEAAVT